MDVLKWILIALAVAAVTAATAFFVADQADQHSARTVGIESTIDNGTVVFEQNGSVIGHETFRLLRSGPQLRLRASIDLDVQGSSIQMEQRLRLRSWLQPTTYNLKADLPGSQQAIEASIDEGQIAYQSVVDGQTQDQQISAETPIVVLDNNSFSHYLILYRHLREMGEARQMGVEGMFAGTAYVPQAGRTLPLHVEEPLDAELRAGDRTVPVERFRVRLGDVPIDLYGQNDMLFAMRIPSQSFRAYREEVFPNGVEIVEPESNASQAPNKNERDVSFPNGDITLAGTLTLPPDAVKTVPAVLMLHGSGAVDRNENASSIQIDAFNTIASHLVDEGIASLRYDKRGVGESGGSFSDASMRDLLSDARAAFEYLKARPEIDADEVYLLGHSEGAILAPMIAADSNVAGLLLINGATVHSLDWIILEQTKLIMDAQGMTQAQIDAEVERTEAFVQFVKSSEGDWADFTLEEIQERVPWMTEKQFEANKDAISLAWYRDHFAYDPSTTIPAITDVPVLILQGQKDLQVPPGEGQRYADALREAGNDQVTLQMMPDLNHLLRRHPEEPSMSYRHLDEPVDGRVLNAVSEWLMAQASP